MGTWRSLRVAFGLGSLFMVLLIIVYWDDIGGGFNLYPLQERKHMSHGSTSDPLTTTRPSHLMSSDGDHASSPSDLIASNKTLSLAVEDKPKEVEEEDDKEEEEEEEEEKDRGTLEQRHEERTWNTAEEENRRHETFVDEDQEVRKRRITDMCSGIDTLEFPGRARAFEQIPNRELDHLIVDDTHQIIYCFVPKVACTNWKRVMVVLSQSLISPSSGKPYSDPEAVPPELVHNSSLHLTFAKFWRHYGSLSRHLMALKLQHYTKFLFVRDPFVRLISAFRNKFGRPNEDFYRQFGSVMLHRYGNVSGRLPETAAEAFAAGVTPTFQQFITYLLDPETEKQSVFNEHWRQVYRLCHPCQVKYDFIGRLETLETDAEHLLKLLKVDHLVHFPSGARNRTAASWERAWFAKIPMEMRRELYKLYEPDFELFGYPKPDSVLH